MNSHDSPLLHIDHISLERDGRTILDNIDFTVHTGDFVAITGPNGGGKTSLLKIILGLLRPTSGCVRMLGNDIPVTGYLPQKNTVDSHFPITVRQVVESGITPRTRPTAMTVAETLGRIGMADLAEQPIGKLSGGQLQRTLFGRAIIGRPALLVLDEPLSYLDSHFSEQMTQIVRNLSEAETTILMVSHQLTSIATLANRHIIIDRTLTECHTLHHHILNDCDCSHC